MKYSLELSKSNRFTEFAFMELVDRLTNNCFQRVNIGGVPYLIKEEIELDNPTDLLQCDELRKHIFEHVSATQKTRLEYSLEDLANVPTKQPQLSMVASLSDSSSLKYSLRRQSYLMFDGVRYKIQDLSDHRSTQGKQKLISGVIDAIKYFSRKTRQYPKRIEYSIYDSYVRVSSDRAENGEIYVVKVDDFAPIIKREKALTVDSRRINFCF